MSATVHQFVSPIGGVMTAGPDGAISGDLLVRVREDASQAHVEVAYAETDDWYVVEGSPLALTGPLRPDAGQVLADALASDSGVDDDDNPRSTDLTAFPVDRVQKSPQTP